MPSVAVIIRLYNDRGWLEGVLKRAASLAHKEVTFYVVQDSGSTDGTSDVSFSKVKEILGSRQYMYRTIDHCTAWEAFRNAAESTAEDYLLILDADNYMVADRVRLHLDHHPDGFNGACAGLTRVITPDEYIRTILPRVREVGSNFAYLSSRNEFDGLNLMLNGGWTRKTLLPAMRRADELVPGEKIEDWFTVMLAKSEGVLHYHSVHVGDVHERNDSLSRRRDVAMPSRNTREAMVKVLGL